MLVIYDDSVSSLLCQKCIKCWEEISADDTGAHILSARGFLAQIHAEFGHLFVLEFLEI